MNGMALFVAMNWWRFWIPDFTAAPRPVARRDEPEEK